MLRTEGQVALLGIAYQAFECALQVLRHTRTRQDRYCPYSCSRPPPMAAAALEQQIVAQSYRSGQVTPSRTPSPKVPPP